MKTLFQLLICLSVSGHIYAQSNDYYAKQTPAKSYWKLQHNASSDQKLFVQFYNTRNELIYEEPLLGDAARLTKNTVRVLNEKLTELTTQRLIANQLDKGTSSVDPVGKRNFDTKLVAYKDDIPVFVTKPVVMDKDRIKVYFTQLDERLVSINISDPWKDIQYFQDVSHLPTYRRTVNLQQLPDGEYTLKISRTGYSFKYNITINRDKNIFGLQPQ
ncbi:MAG: hypothetical protein QM669_14765 [Siphonobacter sp.]